MDLLGYRQALLESFGGGLQVWGVGISPRSVIGEIMKALAQGELPPTKGDC